MNLRTIIDNPITRKIKNVKSIEQINKIIDDNIEHHFTREDSRYIFHEIFPKEPMYRDINGKPIKNGILYAGSIKYEPTGIEFMVVEIDEDNPQRAIKIESIEPDLVANDIEIYRKYALDVIMSLKTIIMSLHSYSGCPAEWKSSGMGIDLEKRKAWQEEQHNLITIKPSKPRIVDKLAFKKKRNHSKQLSLEEF